MKYRQNQYLQNIQQEIKDSIRSIRRIELIYIMLGAMILTFGIYNVHQQSGVTEGGVIGLIVLLHHFTNISPAIIAPVLDILCYGLAFKYLGINFLVRSGICSIFVSGFFALWESFPPVLPNFTEKPIVAVVLGAIFVGIGVGFIVSQGGSSGGDDAAVIMICRATKWNISRAYMLTDGIILLLSLTYIPWNKIIFSLLTATISSYLIGKVQGLFEKARRIEGVDK